MYCKMYLAWRGDISYLSYNVFEEMRRRAWDSANRALVARSRARPFRSFPPLTSLFSLLRFTVERYRHGDSVGPDYPPTAKSVRNGRGRRRDSCGARVSATHIYVHIYIIYCISNGRTTTSHYMRHWNLYIMNELKEENLLNNYLDIINPRTLRRPSRAGSKGRSYSY